MNEVMKVLTVIGTIFIPLTFIVWLYWMNFKYMPELSMKRAYPVLWIVMIIIVSLMLIHFRRKKRI
jgi:magnesium transporter